MNAKKIGNSGLSAPPAALGTWAIGGWDWGPADERDSIGAIQAALDSGVGLIDTAPIYGKGVAEKVVGKAIAGRRDSVVLATKAGLRWDIEEGEFNFEAGDGTRIYRNLRPNRAREEVEASLRRLQTDRIDLLQTHWPDATTPIADTMGALLDLKAEGKILAIGVCNVDEDQLREYLTAGPLDALQEMYSMVDRAPERGLFPAARRAGMATFAYSPLAMGLLTGKIGPERVFEASDLRSWSPRFSAESRRRVAALLKRLVPIARGRGLSLAQLAIAWTAAQPAVTHVLCGARHPEQARENARAAAAELSEGDLAAIDRVLEEEAVELPHPFLG